MNPAMNLLATNPCGTNEFWCNQMYQWTGSEAAAQLADLLLGRLGLVLLIVLGGFIARFLTHRLINRIVVRAEKGMLPSRLSTLGVGSTTLGEAMSAFEGDHAERRVARARTMGSLMKSIATILIFTIVVLMSLAELSINIAPLLASAGIAGVALGFGAQSLVKDFLNGLFMMFEDQYGVGDTVDLGEAIGVVEAVSPRVTRVRDYAGTVWYVRNGEILRVGNSSQNWARVVVDVAVKYDADLIRVKSVLADVGEDLWTDEDLNGLLIEKPEVVGVQEVVGNIVTVRVALKTAPTEQLPIARLFRERAKLRFEHEGIEVPTTAPWPTPPVRP